MQVIEGSHTTEVINLKISALYLKIRWTTHTPDFDKYTSLSIFIIVMGLSFDHAPERPENIEQILSGLDRYNPETTVVFQDYVAQQCEDRTYDCYANLALLKL